MGLHMVYLANVQCTVENDLYFILGGMEHCANVN